jgi:serine/threonine protein kinase/DNA-binding SARP family transcriptional activator
MPENPIRLEGTSPELTQAGLPQNTADYPSLTPTSAEVPPPAMAGVLTGSRRGRFTILKPHALGGLGQVSLARDDKLGRQVALKEIRPDRLGSAHLQRRFLTEAGITSQLEHPGIVPIYQLDEDENGRPFYAMRFIAGRTLAEAIREFHRSSSTDRPDDTDQSQRKSVKSAESVESFTGLAIRELLQRFVSVCQTIAYAHSKGVIHRDLKPANIMLGAYGETLVLDWGLAKRIDRETRGQGDKQTEGEAGASAPCPLVPLSPCHEPSEAVNQEEQLTQQGQVLGTPAYMSPEQAVGEEVGPASDIYALGSILYEILTGAPPYRGKSVAEVLEQVRQVPPLQIQRNVPAALRAVCQKAMARQAADRYASATELAEDIGRWLAGEPVSCHREGLPARAGRWARKHRTLVTAGALVLVVTLLALTAGLIVFGGLNKHLSEKNTALETAVTNEKQERDRAEGEKQIARAVRDFLQKKLLAQADVRQQAEALLQMGGDSRIAKQNPTVRELLDRAAAELTPDRIESQFPKQPLVQAEILQTVGNTYRAVGEFGPAMAHLTRARELRELHLGPDHPDTLITLYHLALTYGLEGKLKESLHLLEHVHDRQNAQLGADHTDTLTTLQALAEANIENGRFREAVPLLELARDNRIAQLGPDHRDTLEALEQLAGAHQMAGNGSEAIRLYEQVREKLIEQLGPEHPISLRLLNNLAFAYQKAGKIPEAIRLFEQIRDKRIEKLGPDAPGTLITQNNLAWTYFHARRYPDAIRLFEDVRETSVKKFGPDYEAVLDARKGLAWVYLNTGKLTEAIAQFEQVRDKISEKYGPDDEGTLSVLQGLATAYRQAGRHTEAIRLLEQVHDRRTEKIGADHPYTIGAGESLGIAYRFAGRVTDAIRLLEQVHERSAARLGPEHAITSSVVRSLASSYAVAGQYDDRAELAYRSWLKQERQLNPPNELRLAQALASLGLCMLHQQKSADAEPILRECLAIREKKEPDDWRTFNTKSMLGEALAGQKKYADAESLLLAGYEGMKERAAKTPGANAPGSPYQQRSREALERLVQLYDAWGKPEEAPRWRKELEAMRAAEKPPGK